MALTYMSILLVLTLSQLLVHPSEAQYYEYQSCDPVCTESCEGCICSCPTGFELSGINCYDIDECDIMNGGCQHICINIPGSFRCGCDQGFLLTDLTNCEVQSCDPVLAAPANGIMICDRQTVGGTCNFTCHDGYTLRGSESRHCLPSLQWREPPALCDPPICPELSPPVNGFVLFPCSREEGHLCDIVCAHGYAIEGPSNQTCRKNSSGILVWSQGPECVERRNTCTPSPCHNGGYCIDDKGSEPTCVCNGTATGYGGQLCEKAVVSFLPISSVTGLRFSVTLLRRAIEELDERVPVRIDKPQTINNVIDFDGKRNVSRSFTGGLGVVKVTLKNLDNVIYEPRERTVFLSADSNGTSYFEVFNTTVGQLHPGCCSSDDQLTLSCPGSTQPISLLSTCQWKTTNKDVTRTFGVVFAQRNNLYLPISISGFRYRDVRGRGPLNDIRPGVGECTQCTQCKMNLTTDTCHCYDHTAQHTLEFIQTRALAFTFINNMRRLLPSWLDISINQTTLNIGSDNDLFAPVIRPTDKVSSLEGCERLTDLVSSRYSVLRYDKTISAVIDGQRYDYSETGTSGGDVMCFAVDLCHESESPVHMQISQSINDILVSQYLSQFTDRGWDIIINTVSVYRQPFSINSNNTLWNGVEMITPPDNIMADVMLEGYIMSTFNQGDLHVALVCDGNSSFSYQKTRGLFDGHIELEVTSRISGNDRRLFISTPENEAYFNIQNGDPCQSKTQGMFFKANYQQPTDLFFSHLLRFSDTALSCPFSETVLSCPFNAYIPITSDYTVLGLSLHTQCPLLAIGELVLPEMSHTLTFIQSSNRDCFTTNFLQVTDPALVIESDLVNPHLQLGNIIQLQSYSSGPDVVTVFERERSGPVSLFHSVAVTLFGGRFESEGRVRNDELTISSSNCNVFDYPAEMTITAPSNKTDWQDLELTVEGSLLSQGENSFVQKLRKVVTRKVIELARRVNSYHVIAEISKERSLERLIAMMSHFDDSLQHVSHSGRLLPAANNEVQATMQRLREIQSLIVSSGSELSKLVEMMDELCTLEQCQFTCVHGELCRSCDTPQNSLQCPGSVSHRPPSLTMSKTIYQFDIQYVLKVNQTHTDTDCETVQEGIGPSVSFTTSINQHLQRLAEVDVKVSENRNNSLQEVRSSDSGACCANVSCAAYAPNLSCLANNKVCESIRKHTLNTSRGLTSRDRELVELLLTTQSDVIAAKTSLRKAKFEHEKHIQRREQLNSTLMELKQQHTNAMGVYNKTMERIGPLLEVYTSGKEYGFETILDVTNVTFNTKLIKHSPTSLILNMILQKRVDDDIEIFQMSSLYISTLSEEMNFERISADIIRLAFPGTLEHNHQRQTRATMGAAEYFNTKGDEYKRKLKHQLKSY